MSEKIHELLNRNLQEVFGAGDAGRDTRPCSDQIKSDQAPDFPLEHDLFRKPGSTFRGHALAMQFVGDLGNLFTLIAGALELVRGRQA